MFNEDHTLYWADKLQKNSEEIRQLTKKMYDRVDSLTYGELLQLRFLLEENRSFITLLNEDLAQPDPTPVPRWKKFLRK